MRILILTQTVDTTHPILGFFHRWILEFATQCTQVTVVCLQAGTYDVPPNVSVYSLGKEEGKGRLTYLWRFYTLAWKLRREYDCVFVHMNPEYVVLGAPLWLLLGKRVALWYTHKSVDRKLRMAVRMAHIIFTASKESFRIASPKVCVVGHGIDTTLFSPHMRMGSARKNVRRTRNAVSAQLLTIGRVTPTKRLDMVLDALSCVCAEGVSAELTIIGAPFAKEDYAYERAFRDTVVKEGYASVVHFGGAMTQEELPHAFHATDVFVHTSETGSLDKVVLEALACGVPVVTTSKAVQAVLPEVLQTLQPKGNSSAELADALLRVLCLSAKERDEISRVGAEWVAREHALPVLITNITTSLCGGVATEHVSWLHACTRILRERVKECGYILAWAVGLCTRNDGGAIVLMYHSVSKNNWRWSVDPKEFERQIRYLVRHRNVVSLHDVIAYAEGGGKLPQGAVALTFDDGYKDTYTEVLPILKKYQVPATLFLTSDLSPMETLAYLPRPSWDEVRALVASGLVDVQVHGQGHVSVYALDPVSEEFREQFLGCARDIKEEVGTQPILVAYPYGDKTRAHAEVLRTIGFAGAFGTREGVVQEGTHPFALPRMSVERCMSRLLFMMRTCTRTVSAFSRMRKW